MNEDDPELRRNVDCATSRATVTAVELRGFRNYRDLGVSLGPGFNILEGSNAQGKTNFLEALHVLATTRLLRGIRDAESILEGEQRATCEAELAKGRTRLKVIIERGVRKRAFINEMALPKASDILGRMPCVCASLADMPIVSGDPADRRMFLDLELSQASTSYLHNLAQYKRALEQRNALLKASQTSFVGQEQTEPWEAALARHGAALRQSRALFIEALCPIAADVHGNLGGGERLALRYRPKDAALEATSLADSLREHRETDVHRGTTTVGPHRDDVDIVVGGRDARLYGSQGQQRTAVLALKLATLVHGTETRGEPPLLLLDDILADLDENRRHRLVEWVLEHAGQAVLTCTELSTIGDALIDKARRFRVHAGKVDLV